MTWVFIVIVDAKRISIMFEMDRLLSLSFILICSLCEDAQWVLLSRYNTTKQVSRQLKSYP